MTTTIYLSIIAVLVLFIIISAIRRAYKDGLMFKQLEECLEEAKELNKNSELTEDEKKTVEYMAAATDFKAPPRAKKQNQAPDTKKQRKLPPPLPLLIASRIEEHEDALRAHMEMVDQYYEEQNSRLENGDEDEYREHLTDHQLRKVER